MTIANDILARLEELWENAEPGPTKEGDAIIYRYGEGDFKIEPSADRSRDSREHVRVIERAKPKAPEWEAVVASDLHDETHKREVYFRTTYGGWESDSGIIAASDLVDPVPLVGLPEHEELARALLKVGIDHDFVWPGADDLADAVLELLKRR